MAFSDDMRRFVIKAEKLEKDVWVDSCLEVKRSVVEGSEITSAPGQPVGQYGPGYHPGRVGGTLRNSWIDEFLSDTEWQLTTNLVYAPPNEEGVTEDGRPYNLRSTVGGRGSVKLTRAGWPFIVEAVTKRHAS